LWSFTFTPTGGYTGTAQAIIMPAFSSVGTFVSPAAITFTQATFNPATQSFIVQWSIASGPATDWMCERVSGIDTMQGTATAVSPTCQQYTGTPKVNPQNTGCDVQFVQAT
jgi:hypothetical protein